MSLSVNMFLPKVGFDPLKDVSTSHRILFMDNSLHHFKGKEIFR